MNKIKIGLITGILALTSFASAATLSPSEFAVRQQMIDFAQYFPNLVSQYYPGYGNQDEPRLGSVAVLDNVDSRYLSINGVKQQFLTNPISPSTSTPCSILLPNQTTNVLYVGIRVNTSNAGAATYRLATSTVPNATTTSWQTWGVSANTGANLAVVASSSNPAASFMGMKANTYLTFGIEGVAAPSTLTGTCYANVSTN